MAHTVLEPPTLEGQPAPMGAQPHTITQDMGQDQVLQYTQVVLVVLTPQGVIQAVPTQEGQGTLPQVLIVVVLDIVQEVQGRQVVAVTHDHSALRIASLLTIQAILAPGPQEGMSAHLPPVHMPLHGL